jgi:hypothetical protein
MKCKRKTKTCPLPGLAPCEGCVYYEQGKLALANELKERVKRRAFMKPPFGNKKSFYDFLDSTIERRLKSQLLKKGEKR